MRSLIVLIFLSAILTQSCKKDNSEIIHDGFFHAIPCDSDMAVVKSFEVNGNYMVIGRTFYDSQPGQIIKLDKNGTVIWKKQLPPSNRVLWKVLEFPGNGFATLGHSGSTFMTVCMYDNDANLISSANINIPTGSSAAACAPSELVKLKNGNYAFSGFDGNGLGFLIITDNAFDSLHTKIFNLPYNALGNVFGLVESPDGSIVMRTATTIFGNVYPFTNLFMIRTDQTGMLLTGTPVTDSLRSETPNCLIAKDDGMLAVTSVMNGWNIGEGFYVNYYNNDMYRYISGSINLVSFTAEGQFVSRKKITSYSGNGMIHSINATNDGGYILCGTVNQSNSSTLVSKTKIYLLKLDSGLNEEWSKTYNSIYQSFGIDAFQASDGGYVVTGHERTFDSKYNMMIIKTDDRGNFQ